MDVGELESLETIDPRPLEPWARPVFDKVTITSDKVQAHDEAEQMAERMET